MLRAISSVLDKFRIAAVKSARLQSLAELDEAERIKFETMIAAMERAVAIRAADARTSAREDSAKLVVPSVRATA